MDKDTVTLVNEQIRFSEVRVIDSDGGQLGVLEAKDALIQAKERGLDLVLVAPNAKPPVCKIIDWGKYQYQAKKKAKAAKAKQTTIEVKEIQLRPVTDTHDLETKLKQAQKFLDQGKKVRFHMKFRGREASHAEIGMEMMNNIINQLDNIQIDKKPEMNGLNIFMIVSPDKQ